MDVSIIPADLMKVKIRVRRINNTKIGEINIPPEIIQRYDLQDKEIIHLAYLCKGTEDLKQPTKLN